ADDRVLRDAHAVPGDCALSPSPGGGPSHGRALVAPRGSRRGLALLRSQAHVARAAAGGVAPRVEALLLTARDLGSLHGEPGLQLDSGSGLLAAERDAEPARALQDRRRHAAVPLRARLRRSTPYHGAGRSTAAARAASTA